MSIVSSGNVIEPLIQSESVGNQPSDRQSLEKMADRSASESVQQVDAEQTVSGLKPAGRSGRKRRAQPVNLRKGSLLQTIAALLWLPQAALVAGAVGQLADKGHVDHLLLIVAGVLLIGILRSVLQAAGERFAFIAARDALSKLRKSAVDALIRCSPLDRNRAPSGLAASVLAEQAETVVSYWSRYQPVQMRVLVIPLVILVAVFYYSWVVAIALLIVAPLIPIFMALIGWRAKLASEKQLVEMGQMNGFLLDRLRGLTTIRTFHAIDQTALRLRENAENLRRKTMIVLRIAFLTSAVLELFAAIGVAMVAVFVGFTLLGQLNFGTWGATLTLGQGLFILLLTPAFFEPLRELSAVWHDRAAGEAAIEALESLSSNGMPLVAAEEAIDSTIKMIPATLPRADEEAPAISLQNVSFRYDTDAADLFETINLTVAAGEHIALFGPSGCGKSTLLALMAGLIAPQSGEILINGRRLDVKHAEKLRAKMAWVGQKPHIFSGSVRSNIVLGRKEYSADELEQALHDAALDSVSTDAGRLDLGENGVGLSGGEGLRLALARAAIKQQVEIIFADEPTAHLDQQTALKAADGLLRLGHNKTLIIATHDEELARRMGRVIRFGSSDTVFPNEITLVIENSEQAVVR